MGLIKAAIGSAGGVMADQWKEFFYCDSLSANTLVCKGQKQVTNRSSNTKGSDNIITNGSGIAVNDGQAVIIVDNGKVVEFCAEPGQFTYDESSEPSVFTGGLGKGIIDSFKKMGARFTYGGATGHDQRVYYFNTKEILDNKYGTPTPVPFKIVDETSGLKLAIGLRCNGVYSYKIIDPILFYTNVCGNVTAAYDRSEIDAQLKSELLTALQPAFGELSAKGIDYTEIPAHTMDLADSLNQILSEKWTELRGLKIVSFGVNSVAATEEDEEKIQNMQMAAAMRDPTMAAAVTVAAQADAMRTAAANENGAMAGFMGMGMVNGIAGNQAANMFAMGQQQQQAPVATPVAAPVAPTAPVAAPAAVPVAPAADAWVCACGHSNTGKFCTECGSPKPASAAAEGWTCSCGAVNQGKFCSECGAKKPAEAPQYRCDKCGWQPEDPANPPKFCPECGDPFGDEDLS